MENVAPQRIIKIRRDYNSWVADETLEDYALRFTPRAFRKWSEFKIANTALGSVSFLALEAIGGAITLGYGFQNALWAILCVSLVIFLTGLPISYYSARYGVDIDLLTRGAGFGYIGSTITSLIYAAFTFIFFALEASIMAQALALYCKLPLVYGYIVCALIVIPLATYGVTFISRLQSWTQPVWMVLLVLPYICILYKQPDVVADLLTFSGRTSQGGAFNLLYFGAASTVAISLIAQIGEQVDFLRFLPEKTSANRTRWWSALLLAGPGWVLVGALKMLGGALLAFLALQNEIPIDNAMEPTQMYLVGFRYVFADPAWVLGAVTLFVLVSQVKINVTNAYAGSLAWSNFFARITHSHPGRVVWLVFNVLIALLLMQIGVFKALEHVLGAFSLIAIAWIGAVVADLVINKPLGLSPAHIEFKRAHLYDINPVGVGAMAVASLVSALSLAGLFGPMAQALAPFIALGTALVVAPAIAWLTRGRYYLARSNSVPAAVHQPGTPHATLQCVICENRFEHEDMAQCPAYQGTICSLCCALDVRCHDRCKPAVRLSGQHAAWPGQLLPHTLLAQLRRRWLPARVHASLLRLLHYVLVFSLLSGAVGVSLGLLYYEEMATYPALAQDVPQLLGDVFWKLFALLLLLTAVGTWWLVLTNESRQVALLESERQTHLLLDEIAAHHQTDAALQRAKEVAESANLAKSRYVTGMSHELRTPLNSILGYAQILQLDAAIPPARRDAVDVIRRSGEHLLGLIDGLLDIARIEAGKMRLDSDELQLHDFLEQMVRMFSPQASAKGLRFTFLESGRMPGTVRTDARRLRQILINLLGNAIKFTDRGSITLQVRYMREIAYFDIIDTGIGIAAADIERIFLPFERSSAAAVRDDVGTGLGLAISRMLVHIMGGQLSAVSVPGQGSTFSAKLYLPQVHAPRTEPALAHAFPTYAGPRKRILIVDDLASQRALLRDMLAPLGFDLVEAASGSACLAAISRCVPDLVLLDIAMPGMDGWAVCRAIRALGLLHLPLMIVSANAFDTVLQGDTQPCNNDFLVKPVSLAELLSKIRRHLNIDWVAPATAGVPASIAPPPGGPQTAPSQAAWVVPPVATFAHLLQLAQIGYVKGILEELDALGHQNPACMPFVLCLRPLAKQFRLQDYMTRLQELRQHAVDAR